MTDDFGPEGPFTLTPAELVAKLREQDCGYDPGNHDHGHTSCLFFGMAADEIERLAERVRIFEELVAVLERLWPRTFL